MLAFSREIDRRGWKPAVKQMDFKATETFHVSLVSDDGYSKESVSCQIGLDGLVLRSSDGHRTLRRYPLNHISRWALRNSNLVLYTKTPVDVEERTVTLSSSDQNIRSVLDTLTCSCMQMVELLQSSEKTGENRQATNSLNALLSGGSRQKAALPAADDVEYWLSPEKTGWLQSQGDHIKTWRRRWFVLKQGYLFRFSGPDVSITTKPRGIVDLSKVTDVKHAREQTGRPNSLTLSTVAGSVSYIADSETELVEWVSALEGTVARIVKQAAGFDDEPQPATPQQQQSQWAQQLEKSFNSHRGSAPAASRTERNPTVKIMGYEHQGNSGGGGSHAAPNRASAGGDSDYGRLTYDSISGIAGIAGERSSSYGRPQPLQSSSSFSDSFVKVDYPSYPVLAPSAAGPAAAAQPSAYGQSSYNMQYAQPAPQQHAYQLPPQQAQQHQQQSQPQPSYQHTAYAAYSAPHEPSFQEAAPQPQNWQVHYTGEGRAYYHNAMTGTTQWEAPAGLA